MKDSDKKDKGFDKNSRNSKKQNEKTQKLKTKQKTGVEDQKKAGEKNG